MALKDRDGHLAGLVSSKSEEGTGRAEKHQQILLRAFTGSGPQWLLYGGIRGGEQDDSGDTWFVIWYEGLVNVEGKVTFGWWKLTVRGEGLEPLCRDIGQGVKPVLKVGSSTFNQQPVKVISVEIKPLEVDMGEEG